ncbi:hypothetical protein F5Y07DRAFT_41017 [Xylaria sp. FL0933]|nr:hypothetical protein F5Y07DRAFT_41017 [Xylaria sp. FL0933]
MARSILTTTPTNQFPSLGALITDSLILPNLRSRSGSACGVFLVLFIHAEQQGGMDHGPRVPLSLSSLSLPLYYHDHCPPLSSSPQLSSSLQRFLRHRERATSVTILHISTRLARYHIRQYTHLISIVFPGYAVAQLRRTRLIASHPLFALPRTADVHATSCINSKERKAKEILLYFLTVGATHFALYFLFSSFFLGKGEEAQLYLHGPNLVYSRHHTP